MRYTCEKCGKVLFEGDIFYKEKNLTLGKKGSIFKSITTLFIDDNNNVILTCKGCKKTNKIPYLIQVNKKGLLDL